jgi:hypothetical protein
MPTPIEHKDKLGRIIKVGDCVAYPGGNTLLIGTVKKLNPKMIGVARLGGYKWDGPGNKYPDQVVVLDGPEVTMYLLKMDVEKNKPTVTVF